MNLDIRDGESTAAYHERLNEELALALTDDDQETAKQILNRLEEFESDSGEIQITAEAIGEPVVEAEDNTVEDQRITITKDLLGIGGFEPVLKQLSPADIDALIVDVADTDDLMALVIPGVSKISADNRIHLEIRGDVRRAARGLALAAADGVQSESGVILSNSGSEYTIEDGRCYQLQSTKQPDFSGNFTTIENKVECLGHLEYNVERQENGKNRFVKTGNSFLRCKHQWALMFAMGFFVTLSKKAFEKTVRVELAKNVGDKAAREAATEQIDEWRSTSENKREQRAEFAKAIANERNAGRVDESGLLLARRDIADLNLPDGRTVAQAVQALAGKKFALRMSLPMPHGDIEITTRVVKDLLELASVIAPHYAVAAQNGGSIVALEVVTR